MPEEKTVNEKEEKILLELSRKTLETYILKGEKEAFPGEPSENLKKISGMFVTLHKNGHLRGCIGYITGKEPLYRAAVDLTVASAVHDSRFRPVSKEELADIDIEISVMSPLRRITNADEIIMGVHGVVVKKGFHQGVFLPQVATETGWDKETFLRELCSQKAGLEPDAWKKPDTELYIFSAQIFGEKDFLKRD